MRARFPTLLLLWIAAIHCDPGTTHEAALRQVLFICEHGAAKSVIAAAYFNQLAAQRGVSVHAVARGSDPQDEPSKLTVAGLRADGLVPAPTKPKPITASDVRGSLEVVAFDCQEPVMKPLSAIGVCWNDVPPIATGYDAVRDRIRTRVALLLDQIVNRGAKQ